MLQRIQSIWLLLAGLCAFASLKMPFYVGTSKDLIPSSELNGTTNFYLMALTIAIGIIALICIFMYNNRKLQLRLAVLGLVMEAGLIFLYYSYVKQFVSGTGTYALTALLQGCVILFFFLAAKGISRDSKIIKESNRLR